MTRSRAIALAAIGTLVVAVLALPRRSAMVNPPATDTTEAHDSAAPPTEPASAPPSSQIEPPMASVGEPEAAPPVVTEPMKTPPAKPTQKLAAAPPKRPATLMPAVDTRDRDTSEAMRAVIASSATVSAPVPAPPAPETAGVAQVTITGCLEAAKNDRFRLTDTEGTEAPKSRSWRSGFLKKRSASVDLVGASDVGALQNQVGRRVAVTGVQTNRELTVASVRVVSATCN